MRIRFHWQNQRFSDSMQLRLRETPEQQWETVSWEWDFLLRILGGLAVTGQFMRDKAGWRQKILFLGKQNMRTGDPYTVMSGQGRRRRNI